MTKVIAVIIESLVLICALWVISFLSTLLHELGHAAGYALSTRGGDWRVRVGSGKKLFETKRFTVKLLVIDGSFEPAGDRIDSKAKLILTLSGGPAVSLILTAAMLCLRYGGVSFDSEVIASGAIEYIINYALFCNAFIFILSMLPTRYFTGEIRGTETDGMKLIRALRDKEEP